MSVDVSFFQCLSQLLVAVAYQLSCDILLGAHFFRMSLSHGALRMVGFNAEATQGLIKLSWAEVIPSVGCNYDNVFHQTNLEFARQEWECRIRPGRYKYVPREGRRDVRSPGSLASFGGVSGRRSHQRWHWHALHLPKGSLRHPLPTVRDGWSPHPIESASVATGRTRFQEYFRVTSVHKLSRLGIFESS